MNMQTAGVRASSNSRHISRSHYWGFSEDPLVQYNTILMASFLSNDHIFAMLVLSTSPSAHLP